MAWLALIGADRVDLLAGGAALRLTPFLVLTPVLLAVEVVRLLRQRGGRVEIPEGAARYALVATLLLAVSLVSVFFSYDPDIAGRRLALLMAQVYGTLFAAVLLFQRPDRNRILVRGAYLGIAVSVAFNLAQLAAWFVGATATGEGPEAGSLVFWKVWSYGPWVPRLSGAVIDMNRGGFVLAAYLFILMRFARPGRMRAGFAIAAVLSIVLTLSRSALLALVVMAVVLVVQSGRLRLSRAAALAATLSVAVVFGLMLSFPAALVASTDAIVPPLLLRLLGDGSSSIHFDLLRHGIETGSASVRNALLGVGFGNSYAVLEEFFPGNEYGNFHSLYLTFLVETGVLALCLGALLLLYPLVRSNLYRPLIAGTIAFGVFYQTNLEPIFWLVLAAAWMEMGSDDTDPERGNVEQEGYAPRVAQPV
jgi:hypothetical protein